MGALPITTLIGKIVLYGVVVIFSLLAGEYVYAELVKSFTGDNRIARTLTIVVFAVPGIVWAERSFREVVTAWVKSKKFK